MGEMLLCAIAAAGRVDKEIATTDPINFGLNLGKERLLRLVGILLLSKPCIAWLPGYLRNGEFIGNILGRRFTTPNKKSEQQRNQRTRLHTFAPEVRRIQRKYRTFPLINQNATMLRFRLISGFVLTMLAGMAFMGLQLPAEDGQSLTLTLTLIAALIAGIGQFASAVVSVTKFDAHRLYRWTISAVVASLIVIAAPVATTLRSLVGGIIGFGEAIVLAVAIVLSIVLWVTIRHSAPYGE